MAHFAKVNNGLVQQVIVAEQDFIDSLPDDTTTIDISNKELSVIPDLSRFTKLKQLDCGHNLGRPYTTRRHRFHHFI